MVKYGFTMMLLQYPNHDIQLYKGNPHWHDRLAFDYIVPPHKVWSRVAKVVAPICNQNSAYYGTTWDATIF